MFSAAFRSMYKDDLQYVEQFLCYISKMFKIILLKKNNITLS